MGWDEGDECEVEWRIKGITAGATRNRASGEDGGNGRNNREKRRRGYGSREGITSGRKGIYTSQEGGLMDDDIQT